MSNPLVPGYVPSGWTRGEELRVHPAPPNLYGYVEQAPRCTPYTGADAVPTDAFFIKFHHDDAGQVEAWLRWWNL